MSETVLYEPPESRKWPWQFFELAGVILLALGRDGTVTYVNQKGAETLGYPVQQILGKDWLAGAMARRFRPVASPPTTCSAWSR